MIPAIRRWVDPFIILLVGTMVAGVLIPVSGTAAEVLDVLTDIAVAFLFLVYGMRIATSEAIAGLKNVKLHGAILGSTFVFFPVLGLLIQPLARPLIGDSLAQGLLYLTLLPSTVQSSVAFTSIAGGNIAAAICGASLSNILGMFITPFLVAIIMRQSGAGLSPSSLVSILVQMLLPFVVGQLLQPWVGHWVRSHRWLTTISDRGTILLVVYSAFSAGIAAGIWNGLTVGTIALLIVICVVMLAIALAFTWWLGIRMHLPRGDRITLLMCGSKKSLATGVPMATILFGPALAAAITLPVMVFHQIQLIACAIIARRLARTQPRPTQ